MRHEHDDTDKRIETLQREIEKVSEIVHQTYFPEYLDLIRDTRRLFFMNFMLGVVRGFGMAIGFTILGAFLFYVLKQVIVLNLPVISDFIAEIIRLVQEQNL